MSVSTSGARAAGCRLHSTILRRPTSCLFGWSASHPTRVQFDADIDIDANLLKGAIWQECLDRGILMGNANFISAAHDAEAVDTTIAAFDAALGVVGDAYHRGEIAGMLRGTARGRVSAPVNARFGVSEAATSSLSNRYQTWSSQPDGAEQLLLHDCVTNESSLLQSARAAELLA